MSPGLVLIINGQLNVCLAPDHLHRVPAQIIELVVERRRHLTLPGPEVDMNLKNVFLLVDAFKESTQFFYLKRSLKEGIFLTFILHQQFVLKRDNIDIKLLQSLLLLTLKFSNIK